MLQPKFVAMAASVAAASSSSSGSDESEWPSPNPARLLPAKSATPPSGLKLRCLAVLMRHGQRTPVHLVPGRHASNWPISMCYTLPNAEAKLRIRDPLDSDAPVEDYVESSLQSSPLYKPRRSYLPGGAQPGVLTTTGQTEMLELGKRLRRDYIDSGLLNIDFDELDQQLYCRSTAVLRCVQSLRCTLAGLFNKEERDERGFLVDVKSMAKEDLFPNHRIVPEIRQLNLLNCIDALSEADRLEFLNLRRELIKKLGLSRYRDSEMLSGERHSIAPLYFLRDDLVAREAHGMKMPHGVQQLMPKLHRACAIELLTEEMGPQRFWPKALPYSVGLWINTLISNVNNMLNGHSYHKMELYSTHDSMLLPVLLALGFEEPEWPPFGSSIVFEFYVDADEKLWARVLYNDRPVVLPGADGEFATASELRSSLLRFVTERAGYATAARRAGGRLNDWYRRMAMRHLDTWPYGE